MTLHALVAARSFETRRYGEVAAAAQKAVLFQLCDRAAPDGVVFPTSQAQLVRWTQHPRRSIQRILDALVATDALVVLEPGQGRTTTKYRLGAWYVPEEGDSVRGDDPSPQGRRPVAAEATTRRTNSVVRTLTQKEALAPRPNPEGAKRARAIREAIASKMPPEDRARARARTMPRVKRG